MTVPVGRGNEAGQIDFCTHSICLGFEWNEKNDGYLTLTDY